MSFNPSEQLRRWLDETEDNERVLGVNDKIEFEEDKIGTSSPI